MLVSKNAGRFRIQSSSFEGLWLLTDELVRRLHAFHTAAKSAGDEPFAVIYAEPLPLKVSSTFDNLRSPSITLDNLRPPSPTFANLRRR